MSQQMSDTPRPTDAELAILQVLWTQGPSTVRAVHKRLDQTVGYTTVLKLLQIMSEKGLVTRDERERAHVYAAREDAARTQGRLIGDLVDRAFAGATSRLVMQALSSRPTSRAELDEIRRFLDDIDTEPDGGHR
jgi:predicted transcriptional regulator